MSRNGWFRSRTVLLNLSSWCLVMVVRLFLAMPRGCLWFVIVVFHDHTHLLFLLRTLYFVIFRRWVGGSLPTPIWIPMCNSTDLMTYVCKVSKVAKIRKRYNQVPHLTQDTNGKVTNSQKTAQTRAKRSALSQQVTTKHIYKPKVRGILFLCS